MALQKVLIGNIKGIQGETGLQGQTGEVGPAGGYYKPSYDGDQGLLSWTFEPSAEEPVEIESMNIRGPKGENGDMVASVYDTQSKNEDIFLYTDNAIKAAIGDALEASY